VTLSAFARREGKVPWQQCHKMDERLRFVARLLEGGKMAELCREFDISRKTGYKIFQRYRDLGFEGLPDQGSNLGPAD
jgi:transposase